MWKAILFSLTLISISIIGFIIVLQKDDPLLPEIDEWLSDNTDTPQTTNNAYIYAMGASAKEGIDPFKYGLQRIENFNKDETTQEDIEVLNKTEIQKPKSDLLCDKRSIDCLEIILKQKDAIQSVISSNQELLKRYKTFREIKEFKSLLKPNIDEVLPEYSSLGNGLKLLHLTAIKYALENKNTESIDILIEDVEKLRHFLPIADNLIFKLIIVSFISQDLELISQLYTKNIYKDRKNIETIVDLTVDETSLILPMRHEFVSMANMMLSLDKNPKFLDEKGYTPSWLVRIVFKPNKTLNSMYPDYKFIADTSLLSPYKVESTINSRKIKSENTDFYNIAGQYLQNLASPSYNKYLIRVHDLQCKIRLLKIKLQDPNNFKDNALMINEHSELSNPYDGSKPYVDEENNLICYSGPYKDSKNIRCTSI